MDVLFIGMLLRGTVEKGKGKICDLPEKNLPETDAADHTSKKK